MDEEEKPARPWRELVNLGERTPAVRITVNDDSQRTKIETNEGDLVLGAGEWILMSLDTWTGTTARAMRAVTGSKDRRN